MVEKLASTTSQDAPHISRRVRELAPSGIRRFFDLLSDMQGVISLGIGEPDYPTPWHVCDSAIQSIKKGFTMYTSNAGMPELRRELSRHLERAYGLNYDPDQQILVTVGVSEALDLAMRAILDPGDEVIVPDPCYVAYPASVTLAGGSVVSVPTLEENGFQPEPDEVERRVSERTRAIIIGSPANPTGAVIGREVMEGIARVARRYNLLVVTDEIYSRLVYGVEHVSMATLPGMKDRVILLNGFSKAYAMTGWRIGYAAARTEVIAAMTKIHQYTIMSAPTTSQVAAIEALTGGDSEVTEMVNDYNRRRLVLLKGLEEIGLNSFRPNGAFYVFPSIRDTGLSSEEFAERLLREDKVAVVPGNAFGSCGEGHVRMCYATSLDKINEALVRIGRFVRRYAPTTNLPSA